MFEQIGKRQEHTKMGEYLVGRRMALFPITAALKPGESGGQLTVAGCDLANLAEQYGTPLYLYDRQTLDAAVAAYRHALAAHYPGQTGITYAGKAFLCLALAQWACRQGLSLDCTGAGELGVATAAGVPPAQIVVHGVNKSPRDLHAALGCAGTLVVDNMAELRRLVAVAQATGLQPPDLWFRLRPGVLVESHAYTQTGQEDSKFGMDWEQAMEAAQFCQSQKLRLTGLHFHLGSQFRDAGPIAPAVEMALDIAAALHEQSGWMPEALSPGGGWGTAYHEDDPFQQPVEAYVQLISQHVVAGCRERNLRLPRLQVEPGRSLVAQAGVALYRIGAVKRTPHRRWLLLDGGLADNPRPALYGARYTALPVHAPERPVAGPAWLAGPYCESGDVLIEGIALPDLSEGELIAIPMSGAYQLSMASNYNGACRPPVLWLDREGSACVVREREQPDDLIRRDRPLPDQAGE